MQTLMWAILMLTSVVGSVALLVKVWKEWYLTDLQKKIEELESDGAIMIEDRLILMSYKLVVGNEVQCLMIQLDMKGVYLMFFDMDGYICDYTQYHEYGDMPERAGEPAEERTDIVR